MPTFAELDRELLQKRGELNELFAAHKTVEGQYDLTPEQCEEVRKRNDELTDLGKRYDAARAAEALLRKNAEETERLRATGRVPFAEPGEGRDPHGRDGGVAHTGGKSIGDLFVA